MPDLTHNERNSSYDYTEILFSHIRLAKIKTFDSAQRRCENRALTHCWWEWELVTLYGRLTISL